MQEIIKRCMEKDREAMSLLYEKYKLQVYRTSCLLTRNASLAEDITQEAFIRIFSKIHLYNEAFSFESWIYKIVLNIYRNMYRRQRWLNLFYPFDSSEAAHDIDTPVVYSEQSEQKVMITEIINTLPCKIKEVIILKYFNDLSQEEIAEALQIPLGTVKSRIHAGLDKIRKQLDADASIKEALL